MAKRCAAVLLTLVLIFSAIPAAGAASTGSLDNFRTVNRYVSGQYKDVPSAHTFAENIKTAYELGLMQGYGNTFGLTSNITRLAGIIIACRVHAIYTLGKNPVEAESGTAQEKYLRYAKANGIYCDFTDYSLSATRAEYAKILSSALPDEALKSFNVVDTGAIPDVGSGSLFSDAIYRLYRAGVLNGSDARGTFYPSEYITRGAACAIATRMAVPSLRKSVTLKNRAANAETIYAQCSSAVAYIEVMDSTGFVFGSGSGFFITSTGHLVTCFHVIQDAASAKIITNDRREYSVSGVLDYSAENDWAVLKVDGSGFPYLNRAGASEYPSGAAVYAIGSPLGLDDTISEGIISNPARTYDGTTYIQTTASISEGSSGGALINKYGRVVGITSGSFEGGQNLNLAVPVSYLDGYSKDTVTPLTSLPGSLPSSGKTRQSDIFDYLWWIATQNANDEMDGQPVYYYDYDETDGLFVIYDEEDDLIYLEHLRLVESGNVLEGCLILDETLEPYAYSFSRYEDENAEDYSSTGYCLVDPEFFDPDSTLTFMEYDGGAQAADEEDAVFMLSSLLQDLELALSRRFYDGYSIFDLGFTAMYDWFYTD